MLSLRRSLVCLLTVMIVVTGLVRAMPHDDFGQAQHTHVGDHPAEHQDDPTDTGDSALKHHAEHDSMSEHVFIAALPPAVVRPDIPDGPLAEADGGLESNAPAPPTHPPNA